MVLRSQHKHRALALSPSPRSCLGSSFVRGEGQSGCLRGTSWGLLSRGRRDSFELLACVVYSARDGNGQWAFSPVKEAGTGGLWQWPYPNSTPRSPCWFLCALARSRAPGPVQSESQLLSSCTALTVLPSAPDPHTAQPLSLG